MPIKAVKQDVADAINNLTALLKRDYGCDFSYSVNGNGFILAQHNINGVQHPIPSVEPNIPKCPNCHGEVEYAGKPNTFNCFFCGMEFIHQRGIAKKEAAHVVLLWHDGNFARKVASDIGEVKMIVVNEEDGFNQVLGICEKKAKMTTKDITPKFPEGHPLNEWIQK